MSRSGANFNQNVARYRGDTVPQRFRRIDENGLAINIEGRSYRLVVDPSQSPADATNNVYELTATITNAAAGEYEFAFTTVQAAAAAGSYFYDVEETTNPGSGDVTETIGGGEWTILQGIS